MEQRPQSLEALTEAVITFRDKRDWRQFHDPKDVSISISLEAAELLEIFQWAPTPIPTEVIETRRVDIADELADIFYWLLLLSHDLRIDLRSALEEKLAKNETKYPVDLARGRSAKYDRLK